MPIFPKVLSSFKLATPEVSEKKTIGTTNIFITFKNISPPTESISIINFLSDWSRLIKFIEIPKITPNENPINIFFVKFFISTMVPSTGYAPVAESYQDPVLLLN